ncbi:MAG: glycosyltransferase [Desulfobacteraceae bacterium]|nr:glycosyltransferase [Desulfobacteraceae bacterium]
MKSIGVIVTTYNRPDALERVLKGLACQSRLPNEIIVADDGSGDDTRKGLNTFIEKLDLPLTHVWRPDQGFRTAQIRNKAILASTSDYLVFLDGDCIPEPDFIRDHITLAQKGYYVQGKRVLVDQSLSPSFTFSDISKQRLRLLFSRHLSNRHHLIRATWFPASISKKMGGIRSCNMAVCKSDLISVNGFNEDFQGWGREDSELVARLYNKGLRRREHAFMAICFHLWHAANNRNRLKFNDELLELTIKNKTVRCSNGLLKADNTLK